MLGTLVASKRLLPELVDQVMRTQFDDLKLRRIRDQVLTGQSPEFALIGGILYFQKRLCVPRNEELKKKLLHDLDHGKFSIHPGVNKMYRDVRRDFWWKGMKRDIAQFVSKCMGCQQVKAEHSCPAGLLQPLHVPE